MTSVAIGAAGPQQVTDTFQYDPSTSLLANQHIAAAGRPLLDLNYRYTPARSLITLTDSRGDSYDRVFQYDALGRLSSVSGGRQDASLWTENYDYDVYGNRSKCKDQTQDGRSCQDKNVDASGLPRDGLELKFDPATNHVSSDQHACRPDVPDFTYDSAGNQTRALRPDGTCLNYRYDSAGRLARVLDDSDKIVEAYLYGADARRLARGDETAGTITHYVWDDAKVIAEYSQPISGGEVAWSKAAIYFGGQLVADFVPHGAAELARYHHPLLSGAGFITNGADSTVIEQQTLPFGTAVPPQPSNPVNPIFAGYDRSSATGLDYAMSRQYDSQERFLQPDPAGMAASSLGNPQSLNLYAYVDNDPTNSIDPSGLDRRVDQRNEPDRCETIKCLERGFIYGSAPLFVPVVESTGFANADNPAYVVDAAQSIRENPAVLALNAWAKAGGNSATYPHWAEEDLTSWGFSSEQIGQISGIYDVLNASTGIKDHMNTEIGMIAGDSAWSPSAWDSIGGALGAAGIAKTEVTVAGIGLLQGDLPVSVVFSGYAGAATAIAGSAGVMGAGLFGWGVGTLIDWTITKFADESLGDLVYDWWHPEDRAPAYDPMKNCSPRVCR
jgi:RHS repeat-associated protein